MNAAEFVLDTLSHFITRADAPPPGVPARPGHGFETELCALCSDHGISAVIAASLDALALPPAISGVTALRLRRDGERARDLAARRQRRLASLLEAFDAVDVPALVMGDARSAALYGRAGERAIGRLEVLVDETRVGDALRAAESAGFSRRRSDVSIEPTNVSPPTLHEARNLVEFHHYMVPLTLYNGEGDAVRIRHRAVDVGRPAGREPAWDRAVTVRAADNDIAAVSLEDHILDLAVRLGTSRGTDLAVATDLGLVLECHASSVNWEQVTLSARTHGVSSALGHTIDRVRRMLSLRAPAPVAPPRPLTSRWLGLFDDEPGASRPDAARDRVVYGLVACGGLVSRLRWLWRSSVPRRAWVERVTGDARRPWSWLAFQMLLHDRLRPARHRRNTVRRGGTGADTVTRIDRRGDSP